MARLILLYPTVISLAGCSSAEPDSVSYSDINILTNVKLFGITYTNNLKNLKRKTQKSDGIKLPSGSIRTSFYFKQLLAAPA
jgi:hypothetical protein